MNIIVKIIVWLFYALLYYLTCSLIMWEFDISKWHIIVRCIFAVIEVWTTIKVLTIRVK